LLKHIPGFQGPHLQLPPAASSRQLELFHQKLSQKRKKNAHTHTHTHTHLVNAGVLAVSFQVLGPHRESIHIPAVPHYTTTSNRNPQAQNHILKPESHPTLVKKIANATMPSPKKQTKKTRKQKRTDSPAS
jgi:hypothetical protein